MGSCVSVHKDPDAVTKLRFSIGSKNEKLMIPSPVKGTVNGGDRTVADVALRSQSFPGAGSKDEAFFDSQPWLESDCEDDFVSVNGDFTPSRGSTPVHHNFSAGAPLVNKPSSVEESIGSVAEPASPPDKKKRLSELFRESLRSDQYADVDLDTNGPKSPNGRTPYFSEGISERTPNGALETDEKSSKAQQCCLPRLRSSRSYSERKKKTAIEV